MDNRSLGVLIKLNEPSLIEFLLEHQTDIELGLFTNQVLAQTS